MSSSSVLCRDCFTTSAGRARCAGCGSPRVVDAPEWPDLAIAHVDCDAFFASVEKRDDPSLADRPVIVGGGRRGVVATCCYVARTYGVRSAMPMFKALKLCPDAVVVRPDMAKYARAGREIRAMMLSLTPLVQPLSIDEAFLDLSGTERLHHGPPAETLARFAARVEEQVGITVSIGLSYNKFLAKVASDLDKPRGFSVIGREAAPAFLRQHSIGLIWGIGQATLARLEKAGLRTIADVQALDEGELMKRVGSDGPRLWRLARGIDDRPVQPDRETKSVSAETTFDTDLADNAALEPILWRLSEKVSARMKASGFAGSSITLKLKTADFQIRTRSRSGLPPTQLAKRIFAVGRELLRAEAGGVRYRLIGIGVSALCDPAEADRGDLVDTEAKRDVATERAIDALRERFGAGTIVRGIGLGGRR